MERGAAWLRPLGKPQMQCLALEETRNVITGKLSSRPFTGPTEPALPWAITYFVLLPLFVTYPHPFPQSDLKFCEGKNQKNQVYTWKKSDERFKTCVENLCGSRLCANSTHPVPIPWAAPFLCWRSSDSQPELTPVPRESWTCLETLWFAQGRGG